MSDTGSTPIHNSPDTDNVNSCKSKAALTGSNSSARTEADGRPRLPSSVNAFNLHSPCTSPSSASSISSPSLRSPSTSSNTMNVETSPFLTASSSVSSFSDYGRNRSGSFTKICNPPFRRQSMLASSSVITPSQEDEDDDMSMDEDTAVVDQLETAPVEQADATGSVQLQSPFLPFPSAIPSGLRNAEWQRSASTSNLVYYSEDQSTSKGKPESQSTRQFNPLNPVPPLAGPSRQRSDHAMQTEVLTGHEGLPMRPKTPSTPFSQYASKNVLGSAQAQPLQRAKSSPSLRLPNADATSSGMQQTSSATFDGLGVTLPDTSISPSQSVHSDLTSPIASRGPVRRAVVRRGSLMVCVPLTFNVKVLTDVIMQPKTKTYMRVQAQLGDEQSPHADIDEMYSEAALHRLNSSRPSSISMPTLRSTSASFGLYPTASAAGGPLRSAGHNRFPENAPDVDDLDFSRPFANANAGGSSDSDELDLDVDVPNSAIGNGEDTASVSQLDMDDSAVNATGSAVRGVDIENWRKERETWLGFRSPGNSSGSLLSRSLGNQTNAQPQNHMDGEQAQRPNKRKMTDENFSYPALSFKRRAVSPTSSLSPALGSPVMTTPLSLTGSYSGMQANPQAFWPRSRQGSPAPSMASTTISSYNATPQVNGALLGQFLKRDKERSASAGDVENVENDMAML